MTAESEPELNISLGLGTGYSESIYKGIDDDTAALPLFDIEYGNFYISGLEAGYTYYETETLSLYAAIAADDLDGERTDSRQLRDLGDVDSGTNLVLGAEMMTEVGMLSASIAQDVADEHKGTQVNLEWGVPVEFGDLTVLPAVSASWVSDKLVNHYYGVSASEARVGRAAYDGDSAWIYGVGVAAEYALNQEWTIIGAVNYEHYSDEITDSSIVSEDSAVSAMMGVRYQF
nr:MipA/OmpV family protein [Aliamphritea spongicola]